MARKKPSNRPGLKSLPETSSPSSPRELIIITQPETAITARSLALTGEDLDPFAAALAAAGATLEPLFPRVADTEMRALDDTGAPGDLKAPDLSIYFRVQAPDEKLDQLVEELRGVENIRAAYIKPPGEPAHLMANILPQGAEPPAQTPDFTPRQGYLDAAPGGIDARYAWTQPGGGGAGVRIIDIEGEWRFTHEDLTQNQGGVVGGAPPNDSHWRSHGTAVIGEFGGDRTSFGVTGICPDANVRAISIFGGNWGSSPAIRRAADLLSAGDIILIELHRPGPRFQFQSRGDQLGYIAIEWWPDDYDAIRYATAKGVLVVEAAGNGAENLDDAIYDAPGPGFPAGWSNSFRRGSRDSGAILVGAGAPPPGTHGHDWGPDRSRLDFSNFGAVIDVQGWGREVTTTGYGDLQGGSNEDLWYTDQFSGTSSASPIVVGALGCVQGNLRAQAKPLLTPASARNLLRTTGSGQQASPESAITERIGNRPNLRQMIQSGGTGPARVPLYRYWNPANADHFYTTNWAELGNGRYGWGFERIQGYVYAQPAPGSVPLYRYWNSGIGDHFYTTNWAELGNGQYGWTYEKIQCYVLPTQASGTVPLYRYWNPGAGDHFYTTNWAELGSGRYGWVYERVQCYIFTNAVSPGTPMSPSETAHFEEGQAEAVPESFRTTSQTNEQVPSSFQSSNLTPGESFTTKKGEMDRPTSFDTAAAQRGDAGASGEIQVIVRLPDRS